jgi:hypothetical protein
MAAIPFTGAADALATSTPEASDAANTKAMTLGLRMANPPFAHHVIAT